MRSVDNTEMSQLYIVSDSGTKHPIGNIDFISNATFSSKIGGLIQVHGGQIEAGDYTIPQLNMKINISTQYMPLTLWNFTLEGLTPS